MLDAEVKQPGDHDIFYRRHFSPTQKSQTKNSINHRRGLNQSRNSTKRTPTTHAQKIAKVAPSGKGGRGIALMMSLIDAPGASSWAASLPISFACYQIFNYLADAISLRHGHRFGEAVQSFGGVVRLWRALYSHLPDHPSARTWELLSALGGGGTGVVEHYIHRRPSHLSAGLANAVPRTRVPLRQGCRAKAR